MLNGVVPCDGGGIWGPEQTGGWHKLEGYGTHLRFSRHEDEHFFLHREIPRVPRLCRHPAKSAEDPAPATADGVWDSLPHQEVDLQLLAELVKQTPTGLLTQPGGSARAGTDW